MWLTDEEKPSPKFCDILINDFPLAQKLNLIIKDLIKNSVNSWDLCLYIFKGNIK